MLLFFNHYVKITGIFYDITCVCYAVNGRSCVIKLIFFELDCPLIMYIGILSIRKQSIYVQLYLPKSEFLFENSKHRYNGFVISNYLTYDNSISSGAPQKFNKGVV